MIRVRSAAVTLSDEAAWREESLAAAVMHPERVDSGTLTTCFFCTTHGSSRVDLSTDDVFVSTLRFAAAIIAEGCVDLS